MFSVRRVGTTCLVLTAFLTGCGDGGPSTPPEPAIRVLGSVQAAGIMSVRTTGLALSLDRYDVTLGGSAMPLARMDDSTLVGIVPDLPAGSYQLTASIAGRSFDETVDVAAARVIADPVAAVDQQLDEIVAAYPASAPAGVEQGAWDSQRDSALAAVDAARTAFDGMTEAEQLAAARYIAAIEDALAPILNDQAALMAAGFSGDCIG